MTKIFRKKYLIYGSSIIISRGLEYVVLFFAAHYLTKNDYGELEYYKKVIEVGASVFSFGFPALILSYTKSKDSKVYFFLLSCLFVLCLGAVSTIFLGLFNWLFLVIPFVFYAIFFTGGISQSYFLVANGSNYVSAYKIVTGILFYAIVFVSIYFFDVKGYAYVYVNYVLFPLLFIHVARALYKEQIIWYKVKKYWKLLKKLLYSSFTLVVSDFANMMFLYTDIFIIKILANQANIEIANYSFTLNIANMLLLISLTLIQVDIEKLKRQFSFVKDLHKRIIGFSLLASVVLCMLFYFLTQYYLTDYKDLFPLFLLLLVAKNIQVITQLYGTMLAILKKFNTNLIINIIALVLNVSLSYVFYQLYSYYGVAIASILALSIRFLMFYKRYYKTINTISK